MKLSILVTTLLALGPATSGEPLLSPAEGATVHALAADIEAIEAWAAQLESCPLETGRLHDLADVQALMPEALRNGLVVQDGWTKPFKAWCDADHWAILSYGEDGLPDRDYAGLPATGETRDDFVVLDGDLSAAPEHVFATIQAGKQRRTMVDMRSIGTVFEAYAIDNEVYPGADGVTQMEPVERILPQAQPVYIRKLPLTDGWGNPFRYWSDASGYRIASAGRDGIFEANYVISPGTGAFDPADLDRDIVFAAGRFEQWPEDAPE